MEVVIIVVLAIALLGWFLYQQKSTEVTKKSESEAPYKLEPMETIKSVSNVEPVPVEVPSTAQTDVVVNEPVKKTRKPRAPKKVEAPVEVKVTKPRAKRKTKAK